MRAHMEYSDAQPGVTPRALRLHARSSVLRLVEHDARGAMSEGSRGGGRDALAKLNAEGEMRRAAAIAKENRAASGADLNDERLLFASRVAKSLEGGRAACLPPEKRQRLVAAAIDEGLRPFDANLIIAIVQDGARRGEAPSATCLTMVTPKASQRRDWVLAIVTLALALGMLGAMILVVRGV